MWSTLLPLIIGGALVPIQIIITILLLRSAHGKLTAVAWVAGMTTVRLLQGVLFGLVLSSSDSTGEGSSGGSPHVVPYLLLVIGVLLLVAGVKQLVTEADPDVPPKWLTATETMGPGKAFAFGAGLLVIGAKFWIFTLGAIAAIGDADLGRGGAIGTFVLFVALTEVVHLAILSVAFVAPKKSDAVLTSASTWLTRHNRTIAIALSFVFGVWFLVKALSGLGVL